MPKKVDWYDEPKRLKFEPIPSYGDMMTWDEFVGAVKCGGFIDYDGHGDLATSKTVSNKHIKPSQVAGFRRPKWATHVCWYNR